MVIWKDIPKVLVRIKSILTCGDIPVARFNETTKKFEEVVNNRGRAYAARKRLAYRKAVK